MYTYMCEYTFDNNDDNDNNDQMRLRKRKCVK